MGEGFVLGGLTPVLLPIVIGGRRGKRLQSWMWWLQAGLGWPVRLPNGPRLWLPVGLGQPVLLPIWPPLQGWQVCGPGGRRRFVMLF